MDNSIAEPQEEIRARRLTIVDSEGRERIVLETSADGEPAIVLLDHHGTPRGRMWMNLHPADDDGPEEISVNLELGDRRDGLVSVGADSSGSAAVSLFGRPDPEAEDRYMASAFVEVSSDTISIHAHDHRRSFHLGHDGDLTIRDTE